MLNLSRMEIWRLFKAKSTYVILLAIIVVYIAFALLLNYNLGLVKEQENTPQESRTHTQNADSIVEISADYSALADLDEEDLGESFIISEFAQGGNPGFPHCLCSPLLYSTVSERLYKELHRLLSQPCSLYCC
ncbi:MAG: hypothetical protein ACOX4A_08450 [Saccharofermentanales bacterium]